MNYAAGGNGDQPEFCPRGRTYVYKWDCRGCPYLRERHDDVLFIFTILYCFVDPEGSSSPAAGEIAAQPWRMEA